MQQGPRSTAQVLAQEFTKLPQWHSLHPLRTMPQTNQCHLWHNSFSFCDLTATCASPATAVQVMLPAWVSHPVHARPRRMVIYLNLKTELSHWD